mmetsp:Transcript_15214/g.47479  ORF Transcript_15214/g.47479 Transcript_15214/m.47479 type:complete len:224 (+) Transcript_15214:202-873(+)
MAHLLSHVNLTQGVEAGLERVVRRKFLAVTMCQRLERSKPVVNEAVALGFHGCLDATTPIVTAHHDVLHLQHVNGKLQHRQCVEITVDKLIGDVTVDEDLTGKATYNLVGGHSRVGTADPHVVRRLLPLQRVKQARIRPRNRLAPLGVALKERLYRSGRRKLITAARSRGALGSAGGARQQRRRSSCNVVYVSQSQHIFVPCVCRSGREREANGRTGENREGE